MQQYTMIAQALLLIKSNLIFKLRKQCGLIIETWRTFLSLFGRESIDLRRDPLALTGWTL
jgi:hypothetical protein